MMISKDTEMAVRNQGGRGREARASGGRRSSRGCLKLKEQNTHKDMMLENYNYGDQRDKILI